MPARVRNIGKPAHDAERQGLRYLIDGLDENFAVYTNPWIVDRSGAVYEVDAVVVAHHAIYVVELKAYRGRVTGNDNDWYVPSPIRSPLKLNRKTAQILSSAMKRKSYDAGRVWVDHLVFLTHTNDVDIDGPSSATQVHTKKTILSALRGTIATARNPHAAQVDMHTAKVVDELLTGVDKRRAPTRRIREYELESVLDRTDRYVEWRARHTLTKNQTGLRVYWLDPLATDAEREKVLTRCRWEAQVLGRVASHPNVLTAQPPLTDAEELHLAVPFELFDGVTLTTWVDKYRRQLRGREGLAAVVEVWKQIASAIQFAHTQGVVHRLLRPEVVLFETTMKSPLVRVTGFDLAKQLAGGQTIHFSSLGDERMKWAAPEVLANWSDARPASDQFGLGVLLGWLLTGSALFDSTQDYQRKRGVCPRLRDRNPFVPQSLDDAVQKMVKLRPAERFPDLKSAIERVLNSVGGSVEAQRDAARLDPENLDEGVRVGTDYEVRSRLGAGGLGTVYLARHLVSGTYRALKVARPTTEAEDALRAEFEVLKALHKKGDAPGIVQPIDLSGLVPDRLTLILERLEGGPLSEWLAQNLEPDPDQLRLYAEDLFGALIHLEKSEIDGAAVVHKDLKPDNLIVGERGLTVIDFSLAGTDQPFAGTALYKDPSQAGWSRASDRYGAALCLHELYTGRHPFGGEAPPPDQLPDLDEDDFDQPGLVAFFKKALDPSPERRHPSAVAMRAAFLDALGVAEAPPPTEESAPTSDAANLPLSATVLHNTAVACLRRAGVTTQGELVALSEEQVQGISGLGKKKARQVIDFRASLIEAGVQAPDTNAPRHVLWPGLVGDPTDLHGAGFPKALAETLSKSGYATVGRLADSTSEDLRAIDGVGQAALRQVIDALSAFAERGAARGEGGEPQTPGDLWSRAAAPLAQAARDVLHGLYGFDGAPETQKELAERLETDQPKVSGLHTEALETLDKLVLDDVLRRLEAQLDAGGGVIAMREAVEGVVDLLPATRALAESLDDLDAETIRTASGIVRVLVRCHEGRMRRRANLDDGALEVIHRPTLSGDDIERFVGRARQIASWPPTDPESARKFLGRELPGFDQHRHSPPALAERLLGDVRLTDAGELFESPVDAKDAIQYVLRRQRLPIGVDELERAVKRAFGGYGMFPEREHLGEVIGALALGIRLEGDRLVPATGSRSGPDKLSKDPPPPGFRDTSRTPEEVASDMLQSAAKRRGFRLVVAPPESHPEIGRSVAAAVAGEYVGLEDLLFERMGDRFAVFEEASRFAAQRRLLTREVEKALDELVKDRGQADARIVLGDAAILLTCDATHLVRKLYDKTTGGTKGFWALVIPGVIHEQQPWFNEKEPVFHIEGQVLPVDRALPAP